MVYGMRFVSSLIPSLSLPHCWVSFPRSLLKNRRRNEGVIDDMGHLIDDTGHLIGDTGHLIDTSHLIDDTMPQ